MNHVRGPLVSPLLLASLGFLIIAAFLVNPFREMPIEDDFSYAWTAKHLVETGKYQVHEWASANPVVQIYCGALFELVIGSQYGSLRVSTLALAFLGILALYGLAKEHGLDVFTAGFVTIVLVSCPLYLLFSFSFNTDIPFVAWLTIALLLYTRAIRLQSIGWMIVASVAGSVAILTRQFGVALVGGMFLLWILERCPRRQVPLLLVGVLLPSIAAAWQFYQGTQAPTWASEYATAAQLVHISSFGKFVGEILWRPPIILQYLVFFSSPLALWAIAAVSKELYQSRKTVNAMLHRLDVRLLFVFTVYIASVMAWTRLLMPLLLWNFADLWSVGRVTRFLITLFTTVGAVAYARVFLLRYCGDTSWKMLPAEQRLLDLVTLLLLGFHLVLFQIGDRYLLSLLPFTLIVVAKHLQEGFVWVRRVAVCAGVLVMVASTMWTFGRLEREEALWKASEWLRMKGVDKRQIFGSFGWNAHHRFDEYFASVGNNRPEERMLTLFREWLPEKSKASRYLVLPEQAFRTAGQSIEGEIIMRIPYRTMLFGRSWAVVVRKSP